ncbi:MAG: ATPase [Candidatus Riflebacteria bacterium HGW-Riflebacteria-1]|jgi:MoxR-like ATPase|nr:MAG: ATPase [Candidatus Riflebacteria bacterium HGW-Riflebacteria-1]
MTSIFDKAKELFQRVPVSPTNPQAAKVTPEFRIEDLYESDQPGSSPEKAGLDEKLRQAYFWITNTAIISPFYDIEYNEEPPRTFQLGDRKLEFTLPTGQSYSSFVLIPLLNLAVRGRCLIVGGPGRGKTATAILMGLLAGYSQLEVKRAIQHGQPQMTIADLLGHPLPADMVKAENMSEIRISWRKWLAMRVKIIDEYNRIPTRTQSALLTVLADNYAEILDQIYECPDSAWYLTANDDGGGGTYQVIEALRDRIDIVIRAFHFNTRFLLDLQKRVELAVRPEEMIPEEVIFTADELTIMNKEIRKVRIADSVRRPLEFFCRHFEFFEPASTTLEYMTKDTAKLSGQDFRTLAGEETGKDLVRDLGSQTKNGLSVRKLMTIILFSKALAWFRGAEEVLIEDLRQIIPFVLHDTLSPHLESPFFDEPRHEPYRVDRITWLRKLFDLSCEEYYRLGLQKSDPVVDFEKEFDGGLEGISKAEVEKRMNAIEKQITKMAKSGKIYGHMADDILKLKYFHQRYNNYRRWLKWKK